VAVGERVKGAGHDVVDIGLRAAEMGLQAALGAVGLVRAGAETLLGSERPVDAEREPVPAEPPPPPREPAPPPPEPREPEHVDEEVVPVAEFAEPGAEDGAGAEIEVDEPWDGYDRLTAAEVQRALADASVEALGVVRLYESTHRGRPSVLETVDQQLARAQ
jgi:hypothetical protein